LRCDVTIGRPRRLHRAGNTAIDVVTGRAAASRRGCPPDLPAEAKRNDGVPLPNMKLAKKGRRAFSLADAARPGLVRARVTGLNVCARTWVLRIARGRRTPEPIPESNFTIEVDMIVGAVGQKPVTDSFAQ